MPTSSLFGQNTLLSTLFILMHVYVSVCVHPIARDQVSYLPHGAESFLRSHELLSRSRIRQHFMEPVRFIRDQVSYPYKTRVILIFTHSESRQGDKTLLTEWKKYSHFFKFNVPTVMWIKVKSSYSLL